MSKRSPRPEDDPNAFGPVIRFLIAAILIGVLVIELLPILRTGSL
jgi:hypothetical protein